MSIIKQPLFIFLFWLLLFISALHHLAIYLYFYWTVWWFDMVMHFLGGVGMATALLWIFYWSGYVKKSGGLPLGRALVVAILASFVIGVLWEIFEVFGGIIMWPEERADSYSDLVLDTLGGIAAYFNSLRYRKYLPNATQS